MRDFRENKGITLIALIVTIVVLLIIAGISINMGITGVDQASDNRLMSELEKVQHAITQRYTNFELTKDTSLIVGTKVDDLPTIPTPTGESKAPTWKVLQFTSGATISTHPERKYYRLSKSDLENLGLTGDYKNSSYIVNYYSGEVYDEVQKQTSSGIVLYKAAIENEASELGDDYIKDGMQVWYDGVNNTGSGHSNNTTIWKDLSGNNNDAKIETTGSSLNWQNNCLATNKAESIITPWKFDTSHTISVVFAPLEFYNYNTIWENSLTDNDNEAWCGINGDSNARSKAASWILSTTNNINRLKLMKKTSIIIVIDNKNNCCMAYVNGIEAGKNDNKINLNGGKLIFNGGIQNTFGKNNYYTMKVYNRALSEDEIHHNYILDKARYGIEE